jgi:hypothetical protein
LELERLAEGNRLNAMDHRCPQKVLILNQLGLFLRTSSEASRFFAGFGFPSSI